jgi:hypothetical protein
LLTVRDPSAIRLNFLSESISHSCEMSSKEAGYLRFNFVIPTTSQLRALMTSQKVTQTNDTWESIELGFPQTPCVHALGAAARGDQVPFMPCIYVYIPGRKTCSCSLSQTSSQLCTRIETSGKHRRHEVSPARYYLSLGSGFLMHLMRSGMDRPNTPGLPGASCANGGLT